MKRKHDFYVLEMQRKSSTPATEHQAVTSSNFQLGAVNITRAVTPWILANVLMNHVLRVHPFRKLAPLMKIVAVVPGARTTKRGF